MLSTCVPWCVVIGINSISFCSGSIVFILFYFILLFLSRSVGCCFQRFQRGFFFLGAVKVRNSQSLVFVFGAPLRDDSYKHIFLRGNAERRQIIRCFSLRGIVSGRDKIDDVRIYRSSIYKYVHALMHSAFM